MKTLDSYKVGKKVAILVDKVRRKRSLEKVTEPLIMLTAHRYAVFC